MDHSHDVPVLPLEIILKIVESLAPGEDAIMPPSHDNTKTLLVLMRVCKATNRAAARVFGRHCIYLDSEDRTLRFAKCLLFATSSTKTAHFFSPYRTISTMYLASFRRWEDRGGKRPHTVANRPQQSRFNPDGSIIWRNLEPFTIPVVPELSDLPVANAIRDILVNVAPTLTRLIADIPMIRRGDGDDPLHIRKLLREGLKSLIHLEEFVNVQTALYVGTPVQENELWATYWPKLRRLALNDPLHIGEWRRWDTDRLIDNLVKAPSLEKFMLIQPNMYESKYDLDIKAEWVGACRREDDYIRAITLESGRLPSSMVPPIKKVTWINADFDFVQSDFAKFTPVWRIIDPNNRVRVLMANITGRENYTAIIKAELPEVPRFAPVARDWAREHAKAGTLWDEKEIDAMPVTSWTRK